MTLKHATEILTQESAQDIELIYAQFYQYCEECTFSAQDAEKLANYILQKHEDAANPRVESYCFLFLGAVLDTALITPFTTANIFKFLSNQISQIVNFEALDADNNFIHFMNHVTFCAESLVKTPSITADQTAEIVNGLLTAYLRSDIIFGFNEDILLADFILKYQLDQTEFQKTLSRLSPSKDQHPPNLRIFAAKQANKRNLWTTMLALNHQLKIQDKATFNQMAATLAAQLND